MKKGDIVYTATKNTIARQKIKSISYEVVDSKPQPKQYSLEGEYDKHTAEELFVAEEDAIAHLVKEFTDSIVKIDEVAAAEEPEIQMYRWVPKDEGSGERLVFTDEYLASKREQIKD